MPEGHIVHAQARALTRCFAGTRVRVDSPQGRFASSAEAVDRRTLVSAEAFGKHLFLAFGRGRAARIVHVHLGLYGKWVIAPGQAPAPRGEIRLRLRNAGHHAELRGPNVCELLDPAQAALAVERIGPDPIRRDADPDRAWRRVSTSRQALGIVLMDQSVFAGVGNIYRAEALFRHAISPFRPAQQLDRPAFDDLWSDLAALMRLGVRRRRIDTVRPEHLPEAMGRAPRVDRHGGEVYVYRRAGEPCLVCGSPVSAGVMQGRNLYWCGSCQTG